MESRKCHVWLIYIISIFLISIGTSIAKPIQNSDNPEKKCIEELGLSEEDLAHPPGGSEPPGGHRYFTL